MAQGSTAVRPLALVGAALLAAALLATIATADAAPAAHEEQLISQDDLERATYLKPEQWQQYKRLSKVQARLAKRIASVAQTATKLKPEKTKVIVQVGPAGLPGPLGPKGRVGKTGHRGRKGPVGKIGKPGNRGKRGVRGPRGVPGPRGHRGFQGVRGEQGARGSEGPTGPLGPRGQRGVHGPLGRHGPLGPQGPNGPNGRRGPRGQRGARGFSGSKGSAGVRGADLLCQYRDVCGKCNGDESSCARKRTPSTCHAVGDPHYRTFDGFFYNYQVTGEFILAKHLDDFEVQNKQRVCPNPRVRCNMGIAVKAGGHILVNYADWYTSTILINGRRTRTRHGRRHLTPDLSYTVHGRLFQVRYKDYMVRVYTNPWGHTRYMDVYITAPGRTSNGRSFTGLCWTFNAQYNDDRNVLRNAAQFWVGGSARSMFRNPRRGLEQVGGSQSLAQVPGEVTDGEMLTEAPPNHNPHHNVAIAFKNSAQKAMIKAKCGEAHGQDKKDCEFDCVAGEPSGAAASAAAAANLLDHEKLMKVCIPLSKANADSFAPARLPHAQNHEGFSMAFWYIPTADATSAERSILGKGTSGAHSIQVVLAASSLRVEVRMGKAHCSPTAPLTKNAWTHIAAAITHAGKLTVFINGHAKCTNDGGAHDTQNDNRLVVGEVGMTPAAGRVARLFYIPLTLTDDSVRRYSNRKAPTSCTDSTHS